MPLAVAAATALVVAQAQAQKFEVASVKPTSPNERGFHALNCSGGTGFVARAQTLLALVEWAYDLPHGANQVSGGPPWMSSPESTFELHGKVERKVSFDECTGETRELPVYVLSVAKKGARLHRTGDDPKVLSSVTLNGSEIQVGDGHHATASGRGMSMRELARFPTTLPAVGRPVIDKTGLEGYYGFSLDFAWTPADDSRPDIFAALPEQLGLRLEPAKGPVETLIIDRAEKPSEN